MSQKKTFAGTGGDIFCPVANRGDLEFSGLLKLHWIAPTARPEAGPFEVLREVQVRLVICGQEARGDVEAFVPLAVVILPDFLVLSRASDSVGESECAVLNSDV